MRAACYCLSKENVAEFANTHLLLVVQALVVVLEDGHALCLAAVVLGVCVGHVAREDFLPEGEATRGAYCHSLVQVMLPIVISESELDAAEGAAQWVTVRWQELAQVTFLYLL